ncbi:MAG: FHA domain-containing protein [Oscillospiraceae bacterium]|nr:FHA domain-containing protein [Oscillospiraceae bacterium]
MEMKQCAGGGHYYDASIHAICPYCDTANAAAAPGASTVPVAAPAASAASAAPAYDGYDRTRSVDTAKDTANAFDSGRTQSVFKKDMGFDPVVGWLVILDGMDIGRDYRLHAEKNFIGRSEKMDVCIRGDDTVSRDNHATVACDTRDKAFYFSPGGGRGIVRVNDKAVLTTIELKPYDIIEIGQTKIVFIKLRGEMFPWL